MEEKNYQLISFAEDGLSLDVRVDTEKETVWLTQSEMAELFDVDRSRITRHVNSILRDNEVNFKSNVRKTHFAHSGCLLLILRGFEHVQKTYKLKKI